MARGGLRFLRQLISKRWVSEEHFWKPDLQEALCLDTTEEYHKDASQTQTSQTSHQRKPFSSVSSMERDSDACARTCSSCSGCPQDVRSSQRRLM